ncbi:PH domain-containing protein [Lachnospiraceae bacterium C1.1]|nr:PH domain-containing protein [Lachnospiraceae bacterium C1.1]
MDILWSDKKRTLFGLPLSFTKYTLSDDRLFINTGLFTSVENEVRLYRVLDVKLIRTLGQKMFGLGTIHICSADKTMGDFDLKNVKNPHEVKELLSENVEKQRQANRVMNREMMSDSDTENDDEDNFDNSNN